MQPIYYSIGRGFGCTQYAYPDRSLLQCLDPFVNTSSDPLVKCSIDSDGDRIPDHLVHDIYALANILGAFSHTSLRQAMHGLSCHGCMFCTYSG